MSKGKTFETIDLSCPVYETESQTISYWKENKIFEKSVDKNPENKTWTFLDGPPFITGLPHYGTLLSSIPKDIFPRFYTMKGFRVRRVWGWDCHGLPAENKVENKLGIKRKKDIEDVVGVAKFIEECKIYVKDVSSEWGWYVDHIGRWVDFENAYRTMDKQYMESVMWVFKEMYKKGHIYKGLRISLYCPHCATPISNFEVAMDSDNYKEVAEVSNTYKYKLEQDIDGKETFILAWSTTPWTKITTTALAINPKIDYLLVEHQGQNLILAEKTVNTVFEGKKYKLLRKLSASELIGKKYIPHFDFFEKEEGKKCFEIIGADFVTTDEGSGVVTIAPYGEEDLDIMNKEGVQIVLHVDEEGKFTQNVPNWPGMYYSKANPLINDFLKNKGLLFDEKPINHTVATCWRCHERLIYSPQNAWYVDIQNLKTKLFKNNEKVNWFPGHFKDGRFKKSMEHAPDWCISRSRYWGSPVPVWECECGERYVFGSIAEIEQASGKKINDLHKPEIDDVLVSCSKCGGQARRVPEVLDSWIEAGSASFAERHYPFNKEVKVEDFFPPDFIVEYTGQIRAWFYVLHVISTALFDSNAFKNVLVTGVVLGTDGRKMSKNFGNYPDPKEMIQKYGGDALRLYLMGTPVMKAEDVAISEESYKNEARSYILTLLNIVNFFTTYANIDGWKVDRTLSDNLLDKWIIVRLKQTIIDSTKSLENYDTVSYVSTLKDFVNDLSTWYLRRSRDRRDDLFYSTIYYVLVEFSKVSAPMTPFVSEKVYRTLKTDDLSVHLQSWPTVEGDITEDEDILLQNMKKVRQVVEVGHALRKTAGIPVKQPLNQMQSVELALNDDYSNLICEELNVKKVKYSADKDGLDTTITKELEDEAKARDLIRRIQEERKRLEIKLDDQIVLTNDWMPEDDRLRSWIISKTLVKEFKEGQFAVTLE